MINQTIKKELDKCTIKLPEYDDSTTLLFIKKDLDLTIDNPVPIDNIELQFNRWYVIKLEYYILHPPSNFTLSSNWNKGVTPISEYICGTPIKNIGKMICWNGTGFDIEKNIQLQDNYNELWLPSRGFSIIKEMKGNY